MWLALVLLLGLGCRYHDGLPGMDTGTGAEDRDGDGYDVGEDCDDGDDAVHPDATETFYDGVDQDCDGANDYDADGDGYVEDAANAGGTAPHDGDCDDADADVHPGATEHHYNDADEDCDPGNEWDADGDGYGCDEAIAPSDCPGSHGGDCDDSRADTYPGAPEIYYDGIDQDCAGGDDWDQDGDGYTLLGAPQGSADDCDDLPAGAGALPGADVHPGAVEAYYDGVDQDCDGRNDFDADGDGYVHLDHPGEAGGTATGTGDCDDDDSEKNPGATEIIGNGKDDDCDGGARCWADQDEDGDRSDTVTVESTNDELCTAGYGEAPNSAEIDCDDLDPDQFTGGTEIVGTGVDEDCNGASLCWVDADHDGDRSATEQVFSTNDEDCLAADGEALTAAAIDCDETDPGRSSTATEITGSGADEDCDGVSRCWADGDGDGDRSDIDTVDSTADQACTLADGEALDTAPVDCDDDDPEQSSQGAEVTGSGKDEDCDGISLCWADGDGDGDRSDTATAASTSDEDCLQADHEALTTAWVDCDDADPQRSSSAAEVTGSGVDEDCDGISLCWADDDGDGDRSDTATVASTGDEDCLRGDGEALEGAPVDCDDGDPAQSSQGVEVTGSGKDEDCDGVSLCWLDGDADGDRHATDVLASTSDEDCLQADHEALTTAAIDCDDADPTRYSTAEEIVGSEWDEDCDGIELCWVDGDGDGNRSPTESIASDGDLLCLLADGEAPDTAPVDCDDADPLRNDQATEIEGSGVDENCDGISVCWADADQDGERSDVATVDSTDDEACLQGDGEALFGAVVDCDDADAAQNHSATEVAGSGKDEDCDGTSLCWVDADGDGDRSGTDTIASLADEDCLQADNEALTTAWVDCDEADPARNSAATEILGSGVDENCDGVSVCWADSDQDGERSGTVTVDSIADEPCLQADGEALAAATVDCDDGDPAQNHSAIEVVGSGKDEDCNGASICYRDADRDGDRHATQTVDSIDDEVCSIDASEALSTAPIDCDDQDSEQHKSATEVVGSGKDEDCDGVSVCYADQDGDGERHVSKTVDSTIDEFCFAGAGEALASAIVDCDDGDPNQNHGVAEVIGSGKDDDCDGTSVCYLDKDTDGARHATSTIDNTQAETCLQADAMALAVAAIDCNDDDPTIHPGAAEIWYDGTDQDCSGGSDYDQDGDGYDSFAENGGKDCNDTDKTVWSCGSSPLAPGLDCFTILTSDATLTDGQYYITAGGGAPIRVTCDMAAGGWIALTIDNSQAIVMSDAGPSNPWLKCASDSALHYDGITEAQVLADLPYGDNTAPLDYIDPTSLIPFSGPEMTTLRAYVTELHSGTRIVAVTSDDDNGNLQGGSGIGHEVWLNDVGGNQLLLTPGEDGECGGGTGWPAAGSWSGYYLWHPNPTYSQVDGTTVPITDATMPTLPTSMILPKSVRIWTATGGGASFGWERDPFLVR